jgi:hypothetical protein
MLHRILDFSFVVAVTAGYTLIVLRLGYAWGDREKDARGAPRPAALSRLSPGRHAAPARPAPLAGFLSRLARRAGDDGDGDWDGELDDLQGAVSEARRAEPARAAAGPDADQPETTEMTAVHPVPGTAA